MKRPEISVKKGMEKLVSHAGLLYIGELLKTMGLRQDLDNMKGVHCTDPFFSHADILFCMLGMISLGKPDYEAIESIRSGENFFIHAFNISKCPSAATIRQRINLIGNKADSIIKLNSAEMIRLRAPAVSAIQTTAGPLIPLDIDVSPFDNSKTKKEGVSRTYKGCDGYAPIFAYLGTEGYLANLEFREGSQHCQKDTPQFIEQALDYARQITEKPILMRLDSGNDSRENFPTRQDVHFIIKRNLRRESLHAWLELAKNSDTANVTRTDRKTVWIGRTRTGLNGEVLPFPIIFEITERYVKKGQMLVFPEVDVDTYWCDLDVLAPVEAIGLYHDHGTSEQFHSELKTDLDLERLPSGSFASNSLILHLGLLAYNMLRVIGQMSIVADRGEMPGSWRKKVKRRRIKTVMQDLMYMAGRLINHGRRVYLSLGCLNAFADKFMNILQSLRCCPG